MQCPRCKHELKGTEQFCENCGYPIQNAAFVYPAKLAPTQTAPMQVPPKKIPNTVMIMGMAMIIAIFCLAGAITYSTFRGKTEAPVAAVKTNNTPMSANTIPAPSSSSSSSPEGTTASAVQNSPLSGAASASKVSPSVPAAQVNMGALKIEIAGKAKEYSPLTELKYDGAVWSATFSMDGQTQKDYFYLALPGDVKAGSKFTFSDGPKSTDQRYFDFLNNFNRKEFLAYKNESGVQYIFGNTIGSGNPATGSKHYSSVATLTVDSWGGPGGEASGTISGEIRPSPNDAVTFKNGQYKIKIKSNGF